MKLEINSKRKIGKFTNVWKLNNTPLNNQWVKEESQEKLESILKQMRMKTQHTKTMGCSKSSIKMRGKFLGINAYVKKEDVKSTK